MWCTLSAAHDGLMATVTALDGHDLDLGDVSPTVVGAIRIGRRGRVHHHGNADRCRSIRERFERDAAGRRPFRCVGNGRPGEGEQSLPDRRRVLLRPTLHSGRHLVGERARRGERLVLPPPIRPEMLLGAGEERVDHRDPLDVVAACSRAVRRGRRRRRRRSTSPSTVIGRPRSALASSSSNPSNAVAQAVDRGDADRRAMPRQRRVRARGRRRGARR